MKERSESSFFNDKRRNFTSTKKEKTISVEKRNKIYLLTKSFSITKLSRKLNYLEIGLFFSHKKMTLILKWIFLRKMRIHLSFYILFLELTDSQISVQIKKPKLSLKMDVKLQLLKTTNRSVSFFSSNEKDMTVTTTYKNHKKISKDAKSNLRNSKTYNL